MCIVTEKKSADCDIVIDAFVDYCSDGSVKNPFPHAVFAFTHSCDIMIEQMLYSNIHFSLKAKVLNR